MKKLIKKIKNWIITSLGGYIEEEPIEYAKVFQRCKEAIDYSMHRRRMLVEALKDSNILSVDYGVKYSYSLCKYCVHKNNCKDDCAHGEDFIFADNWKEI